MTELATALRLLFDQRKPEEIASAIHEATGENADPVMWHLWERLARDREDMRNKGLIRKKSPTE